MTNALQGAKFVLNHKTSDYSYETKIENKLTLPQLPEGEYTYSLSKRGYETNKGTIHIGKGTNHLKLSLTKKQKKKTSTNNAKQ